MIVDTADNVIAAEHNTIKLRRTKCKTEEGNPQHDAVGLALSGGGVRSATFNLGLLQALHEFDVLKKVDYLSTVSGGGYVGASLTRYLNCWPDEVDTKDTSGGQDSIPVQTRFPFNRRKQPNLIIAWIRAHASYLTPGRGLNKLALLAAIIRGILVNFLVILPLSLFLVWIMSFEWQFNKTPYGTHVILGFGLFLLFAFRLVIISKLIKDHRASADFKLKWEVLAWVLTLLLTALASLFFARWDPAEETAWARHPIFAVALIMGVGLLIKWLIGNILLTLLSTGPSRLEIGGLSYFSAEYGHLLGWGIGFCLLGSLPWIHELLISPSVKQHITFPQIWTAITAGGGICSAIGWAKRGTKGEFSGFTKFFVQIGLSLLVLAFIVLLFHVARSVHESCVSRGFYVAGFFVLVLSVWLSTADINYVSMHRYYGDRLLEAYLKDPTKDPTKQRDRAGEYLIRCVDVTESGAPYPLINCNLVTTGSSSGDTRYRLRGGDNFIFSPEYIGAESTGYARNRTAYRLATAMTVSGAAVDPHTGEADLWALRFLMSLLNARLGYWILHPGLFGTPNWYRDNVKGSWIWLIATEMFSGPKETTEHVRLSDGGHFENLGLYELLRRRCHLIIAADAGADKHWQFTDLSRAIERVRVDFGADISINLSPLIPDRTTGRSQQPFSVGSIAYHDGQKGTLIYIKTTLFDGLPADILGYRSANTDFPDESTLNQFFTEVQFEAYRELGYQSGKSLFESIEWTVATRNTRVAS